MQVIENSKLEHRQLARYFSLVCSALWHEVVSRRCTSSVVPMRSINSFKIVIKCFW